MNEPVFSLHDMWQVTPSDSGVMTNIKRQAKNWAFQ